MYNYLMLVGTITKDVELREVAENKRVVVLDMAVKREFRNAEGSYDTDFIKVSAWDFLADIAKEQVKKGSKIGIKGRVSPHIEQLASGAYVPINELIAERLFFFDRNISSDDILREKNIDAEQE